MLLILPFKRFPLRPQVRTGDLSRCEKRKMAKDFSKQFYKSQRWKQIREFVLMRDKYLCQKCGSPASEVHHIIPVTEDNISFGETHTEDNLVSLCRDCHCRIHDKHRTRSGYSCDEEYCFGEDGQLVRIPPPLKNETGRL